MAEEDIETLTAERDKLVRQILASQDSFQSTCSTNASPASSDEVTAALDVARKARAERIKALGRYNTIKDIGQMLIGLVADMRGCRVIEVMRELGLDEDD